MKKSIPALIVALIMICIFAACDNTPAETTAAPTTTITTVVATTEDPTTEEPTTEEPTTEATTTEAPTTETTTTAKPTTAKPKLTTTKPTTAKTASEKDLEKTPDKMSKDELIKYYNDAINNVRSKKPKISRTEVLKIKSVKLSLGGGIADGIASRLVNDKMPGTPKKTTITKGKANAGDFMTEMAKSAVKPGDVISAAATKSGANYVITLKLGKEVNPATNGSSKYSRFFSIASRQDVLDDIKDVVTADVNKCTLTYHDGKAVITVNPQGQIIKAHGEFYVDAVAKQVKVSALKTDLTAYQVSTNDYTNFVY